MQTLLLVSLLFLDVSLTRQTSQTFLWAPSSQRADSVASISSFAAANATAAAPGNAGATTSEFDGWTWGASAGLVEN